MSSQPPCTDETAVVIVAIDFGTTFSGICWTLSSATDVKHIIKEWPAAEGEDTSISTQKIPTKLAYDDTGKLVAWGGQVKPLQPRYQEFKLLLDKIDNQAQAGLANKYPDTASLPISIPFTATKLSVDFLKAIRDWLGIQVEKTLGDGNFKTTKVEYVITVPAIWSETAKSATKWCAKEAGMGDDVKLITEPEAAMVHAFDQLPDNDVRVGDAYILCDAGGGTVDLVTYIIRSVNPLRVDEVVTGDGACCGSVYINRLFQRYLEDFSGKVSFWKEEFTAKAMEYFERVAKPKFDTVEKEVSIKISGIPNYDKHGVRIHKGKMYIPSEHIRRMFAEALEITCGMIKEQKRRAQYNQAVIKGVIFVGGFAQSPFARKYLPQHITWLRHGVKFIVPDDGWTAVVQGALSRVLPILCPSTTLPMVESRISRLFYGITYSVEFTPGVDPEQAKFLDGIDGQYYIEKIEWFMYKGAKVTERYLRSFGYVHSWEQKTPYAAKKVIKLHIYSYDGPDGKPPPTYPGAEGVKKVTSLIVDFSKIPTHQLKTYHTRPGHVAYSWCNPHVRITYSFGSVQYHMWYRDVCYGNVETGFES